MVSLIISKQADVSPFTVADLPLWSSIHRFGIADHAFANGAVSGHDMLSNDPILSPDAVIGYYRPHWMDVADAQCARVLAGLIS